MFCPECGTWNRGGASACLRCAAALPDVPARGEAPDALITALRQATGNRYRVLRRIGSGGMADVYLVEQETLGRPLVLKVMHAHLARDPEMRERFRREAEAAARLVHPLICVPFDYGEVGEMVYLIMPHLSGGGLADVLSTAHIMPPVRVAEVGAQIATALDHAHRHGVVHRDVKPDNVLFDEDGNAYLTDFGIATAQFHARLTASGRAMGTPHYMAPEQAMGRTIDGRADLYAMGVMMYECLVGFPPFDAADAFAVGYKQVHEAPVPVRDVNSDVPEELAAIVMRCLEKTPEARYQRGADLAAALDAWLHTTGTPRQSGVRGRTPVSGTAAPPSTRQP
ncbi:MAG: serine/threonine protein kinase [Gemmatimonadetes bacterium]|nr:serine/threonine protein kinase [Gemmatimonadota bacterium]